ncbi:MAG: hypothetical protein J2P29_06880 [Actinobacteria bacterium]|nr:hypothetical protein [Actinomycetota bacterium]
MVVSAVLLAIFGLVCIFRGADSLRCLRRMRKVSDVTGTVVGRDRQFTGKGLWTYPVVEFTTRDGTQIRRTFQQLTRPKIGRKLRIFYDPSGLHDGRARSTRSGFVFISRPPLIYSVWLLLWFWFWAAFGLAVLTLCIAVLAGAGSADL